MEIQVDEIKLVCIKLFEFLEESGIKQIKVEKENYWHISEKDIYNFSNVPLELLIGSINEDWDYLKALITESENISPTTMDFLKLSPIIRIIGDTATIKRRK